MFVGFATKSFVDYIISKPLLHSISVCIIISLILNCWKRKSFFTFHSRKSRTSISSIFFSSGRLCSLQVISFGFRISWWTIKIKKFIIICSFHGMEVHLLWCEFLLKYITTEVRILYINLNIYTYVLITYNHMKA